MILDIPQICSQLPKKLQSPRVQDLSILWLTLTGKASAMLVVRSQSGRWSWVGLVVKWPAQFSLSVFLRLVERLNTRSCLPVHVWVCGGWGAYLNALQTSTRFIGLSVYWIWSCTKNILIHIYNTTKKLAGWTNKPPVGKPAGQVLLNCVDVVRDKLTSMSSTCWQHHKQQISYCRSTDLLVCFLSFWWQVSHFQPQSCHCCPQCTPWWLAQPWALPAEGNR